MGSFWGAMRGDPAHTSLLAAGGCWCLLALWDTPLLTAALGSPLFPWSHDHLLTIAPWFQPNRTPASCCLPHSAVTPPNPTSSSVPGPITTSLNCLLISQIRIDVFPFHVLNALISLSECRTLSSWHHINDHNGHSWALK